MLKNRFETLCQNFTKDKKLIHKLWQEIETAHSHESRHYHTLKHLEHLYLELPKFDAVTEFSIVYHDIVYDASKKNNEEESAKLCEERLTLLGVPQKLITDTTDLINETKTHEPSSKTNALFLDADLAILGSSANIYQSYIENIRKEYAIFNDATYNKGRRKALKHFLEKPNIYQSSYFYDKYEKQAQHNILIEYNSLILQ